MKRFIMALILFLLTSAATNGQGTTVITGATLIDGTGRSPKIAAVIVCGRLIPKSELQEMLAKVEAAADKR